MRSAVPVKDFHSVTTVCITLLFGGAGALLCIISSQLSLKWAIAGLICFIAVATVVAVRPAVEHWLFFYFLTFSIALNFYPLYMPHGFNHPNIGISVNLYDIPLVVLAMHALGKVLTAGTDGAHVRLKWFAMPLLFTFLLTLVSTAIAGETAVMIVSIAWALLKCALIFFMIPLLATSRKRLAYIIIAMLCAVALHSLVSMIQVTTGKQLGLGILGEVRQAVAATEAGVVRRVGGLIGTENGFSKYLGLHLPLIAALFFAPLGFRVRWLLIVPLFIAGAIADVNTYCRGGWIWVSFGLMITVSMSLFKKTGRKVMAVGGPLIIGALAVIILLAMPTMLARITNIEFGSGATRFNQYKIALNIISTHPLLGIGYGNFVPEHKSYDYSGVAVSRDFSRPVHNEYLLMASEQGILTMALYVFMVILSIVFSLKAARQGRGWVAYAAIGCTGGIITYVFQDLTEWSWALSLTHLWSYLAAAASVWAVAEREGRRIYEQK